MMFGEMSTPVLLMASEQSTTQEPTKTHFGSYQESKPESTKPTKATKKSAKAPTVKKQPQRGLGVAQLERLRLQDRWKKRNEMPQLDHHHHHHQNFQYTQNSITLPDPLASVPVHYGASSYNGPFFGFVGQTTQRAAGNVSAGFGYVGGNNLVGDLDPSPYRIGASDPRFQGGAVYETSKELSSMPKMQSLSSGCCDTCLKKKRYNCGANYTGYNGRRDKSTAMILPNNGSDFLGLNPETPRLVARTAGYSGRHNVIDESVEVRAVHRKGRSAGGGIFMEYEFFPEAGNKNQIRGGGGGGTYPKEYDEWHRSVEASVSVGSHEEPSDITAATCYGIGADSYHDDPLDLSLKLSF